MLAGETQVTLGLSWRIYRVVLHVLASVPIELKYVVVARLHLEAEITAGMHYLAHRDRPGELCHASVCEMHGRCAGANAAASARRHGEIAHCIITPAYTHKRLEAKEIMSMSKTTEFSNRLAEFHDLMLIRFAQNETRTDWNSMSYSEICVRAQAAHDKLEKRAFELRHAWDRLQVEPLASIQNQILIGVGITTPFQGIDQLRKLFVDKLREQAADAANWSFIQADYVAHHPEEFFTKTRMELEGSRRAAEND